MKSDMKTINTNRKPMANMLSADKDLTGVVDPVMLKAKKDSDQAAKDTSEFYETRDFIKKEPFTGHNKKNDPKKAEVPKIELDESLFDGEGIDFEDEDPRYTYEDISDDIYIFIDDNYDALEKLLNDLTGDRWCSQDDMYEYVCERLTDDGDLSALQQELQDITNRIDDDEVEEEIDDIPNYILDLPDEEYTLVESYVNQFKNQLQEEYDDVETFCSKDAQNGNAFWIMGYCANAMKECGLGDEISEMYEKATASDYTNLCKVCDEYIQQCNQLKQETDDEFEYESDIRDLDELDEPDFYTEAYKLNI